MQIEIKDVPLGGTFRLCKRHLFRAEGSALADTAIGSIDDETDIANCACLHPAKWTHRHPLRMTRLCGFQEDLLVEFDPLVDALTQSFS